MIVMEVLSESTETFDRGEKFETYKLIPTLCEYLLVPFTGRCIEAYRRQSDNSWALQRYDGVPVDIQSLHCSLAPDAIFENLA